MVDDIIERKWGRNAVVYDLPELKELLELSRPQGETAQTFISHQRAFAPELFT